MTSEPPSAALATLRRTGLVRTIVDLPPGKSRRLELVGPVPLPLSLDGRVVVGQWSVAAPLEVIGSGDRNNYVSVLAAGEPSRGEGVPIVRIHSACFTGEVLGSMRCDCGPQLEFALSRIFESEAGGLVVYMSSHEGRGIGLWSKAAAYLLQDDGLDTYEANRALGHADDLREFEDAAAILHHFLGSRPFRLLTNNPRKVQQLRAMGLSGVMQESHVVGLGKRNLAYIKAKRGSGHTIPASAIAAITDST